MGDSFSTDAGSTVFFSPGIIIDKFVYLLLFQLVTYLLFLQSNNLPKATSIKIKALLKSKCQQKNILLTLLVTSPSTSNWILRITSSTGSMRLLNQFNLIVPWDQYINNPGAHIISLRKGPTNIHITSEQPVISPLDLHAGDPGSIPGGVKKIRHFILNF